MTTNTDSVTLGGRTFPIRPLTLDEIKAVGIGAAKQRQAIASQTDGADWAAAEGKWYDATFEVIAAATGTKVEDLRALPGSNFDELCKAYRACLIRAGLLSEKEKKDGSNKLGEGNGAQPATTG